MTENLDNFNRFSEQINIHYCFFSHLKCCKYYFTCQACISNPIHTTVVDLWVITSPLQCPAAYCHIFTSPESDLMSVHPHVGKGNAALQP